MMLSTIYHFFFLQIEINSHFAIQLLENNYVGTVAIIGTHLTLSHSRGWVGEDECLVASW